VNVDPESLKETTKLSLKGAVKEFSKWRKSARDSPRLLSLACIVACILILLADITTALGKLLTLQPVALAMTLHTMLFAILAIGTEISRWYSMFGLRDYLALWFRFTTRCVGRGFFHVFVGTLAVSQWTAVTVLCGGLLIASGIFTALSGMYASSRVNRLHKELRAQCSSGSKKGNVQMSAVEQQFRMMDADGDGFVSVEELRQYLKKDKPFEDGRKYPSFKSVNVHAEAEEMMAILDADGDGRVDCDELFAWLIAKKGGASIAFV